MLCLSRRVNESVQITGNITVTLVAIKGKQARLGFTGPASVNFVRTELTNPDHAKQPEEVTEDSQTGLSAA